MCGIGGYFSERGIQTEVLKEMSARLRHRGPDDEGFLCIDRQANAHSFIGDETNGDVQSIPHLNSGFGDNMQWGLLHRRLSIIDLSAKGHQPLQDEAGNYILLNGEIYNYRELRVTLENKGYSFFSSTDTEVALKAYDAWGTDCFSRFRGMWAMVIYDREKGVLILSRDRFAIKPLYITTGKVFGFASEPKALLCIPGIQAEINDEALFDYLAYGGSEDQYTTLFSGIREFPAASWAELSLDGRLGSIVKYYDLLDGVAEQDVPNSVEAQVKKYKSLFYDSIQLHLRSDVPIGSCLSGGLDSSAIVAASASLMPETTFRTFTAAYDDPGVDESAFADTLNTHFSNVRGTFTHPDNTALWQEMRQLLWFQDLPIHSTSMFAQWEVMKLAGNNGMKVLLDGQGADEVLGGYDNFLGAYLLNHWMKFNWGHAMKRSAELRKNRLLNTRHELMRAAYPYLPSLLKKGLRQQLRLGGHFLSKDFREKNSDRIIPDLAGKGLTQLRVNSIQRGLKDLLRYEDRNSMAFSIESRVPFLDHKLVEYTLAVPERNLSHKGYSKYLLREAMEDAMPHSITWRKDKKGFITPQNQWQQQSREELQSFLSESAIPPQFDRERILRFSASDLPSGTPSNEFWKLIAILVWKDVFKLSC